jgi:hypothetical protein
MYNLVQETLLIADSKILWIALDKITKLLVLLSHIKGVAYVEATEAAASVKNICKKKKYKDN